MNIKNFLTLILLSGFGLSSANIIASNINDINECDNCGECRKIGRFITSAQQAALEKTIAGIYGNLNTGDLEQRFCSPQYLEIYNKVKAADENLGEIGFFSSNHWVSAQDGPDNPVFEVKDIRIISPTEAIVDVRENEMHTGARLKLIYENGEWKVDDFLQKDDNKSEVNQMKIYLESLTL